MEKFTDEMQSVQEKIRQLKNRQKILLKKKSDAERKARAHRLIEFGAVLESIFLHLPGAPANKSRRFFGTWNSYRRYVNCCQRSRTESARKALANLSTSQGKPTADKAAGAAQGGGASAMKAGASAKEGAG